MTRADGRKYNELRPVEITTGFIKFAEGSVLNVWCWNDEFQSRFNAYYPEVKEVAED